ncbi:hypothetical protein KP509_35G063200 [Ceratopteris richardii]|uniref:C2 domain-containing protein n=1 Tax=Ceratopteris richardii TaxID=49495 RepID=A0A8T2QHP4_CERRI|nr:hypothetical protein KP509_35G063200 [Ceratopteris richardii]KAH7283135.1 hypothetical protein KP509_35G063200 [Ceratopteris richardii]
MAVRGTLEVHLHGGKGIKNVEFFGKNDPYAIISYKTQDQKSKTLEGGGSDPVWDQSFFFQVEDDTSEVIVKIFDEDKRTADDPIGEAKIPFENVLEELEVPACGYDLVLPGGGTHGQVEVSLKFVPTKKEAESAQSPPFHPNGRMPHHSGHPHHTGNGGPYGENNEGGWQ